MVEIQKNSHKLTIAASGRKSEVKLAILSDLHWDNPDCDQKLLKKDLDYCLENDIHIMLNGDTFCLMQGKYDPRSSKSKVRPEHQRDDYLDAVINTAVEFFKPYAELITVVGVGNHECYSPDTEVLTSLGWINIQDVTKDHFVAQFDRNNIDFAQPIGFVKKEVEGLVTIEGAWSKQVVSNKHGVVLNNMLKVNAEDVQHIYEHELPNGRSVERISDSRVSLDYLELLAAVVCDGTFYDERKKGKGVKARVQIKVSKQRKIDYFTELLNRNGVKYSFKKATMSGINKLQPYIFVIYGDEARMIIDILDGEKKFPKWFLGLSRTELSFVLHAIRNTDGYTTADGNLEISSTCKSDLDLIQLLVTIHGMSSSIKEFKNRSGFANGKPQWVLKIRNSISEKPRPCVVTRSEYTGPVFCLTMPKGNFVSRIDGKVAFSGNSGIKRRHETDVLKRFVDMLNAVAKPKNLVYLGGYKGALTIANKRSGRNGDNYRILYFHGSGGGGVVTRGEINLTRMMAEFEGFDCYTMGHIHEKKSTVISKLVISPMGSLNQKEVLMTITGTYKDEYKLGKSGWHVERGAPPKPLGGMIITIQFVQDSKLGRTIMHSFASAFPI